MKMTLPRGMMLIGVVVGIGCLQVAQRNALVLKGYVVGERLQKVHAQERDIAWLDADVTGLVSPSHLARVARERELKLVARLRFPPAGSLVRDAAAPGEQALSRERSMARASESAD